MLNGKRILVIGGTGSWGQELISQILTKYDVKQIVVYSRGEHKQVDMAIKFNNPLIKYVIGDIRDLNNLDIALRGIDIVFHLAALKHVPVCEKNPEETIKTNIIGTKNAVEASIKNNVKNFVLVSTDKAVDPINVYGISKAMAEKIVINASLKTDKTKFVCVRAGNVLGSTGSVVPLFKEQILKANKITITDERMTRYILRLSEAISLIFKAVEDSHGGEIFVTKMPSIKIIDLANVMIKNLSKDKVDIKYIGIRPGEKIHEVLVSRYEATRAIEYGDYFVILPVININNLFNIWGDNFISEEYNSEKNKMLSYDEIKKLLVEEEWLNKNSISELDKYSKEQLINIFKDEGWLR